MIWSKDNLPSSVEEMNLIDKEKDIFIAVANYVLQQTNDNVISIRNGISAVKKYRYKKDSDIENIFDFEFKKEDSNIQSIRFKKNKFTKEEATQWLKKYNRKYEYLHETENEYRFCQLEQNFDRYAQKEIDTGIIFLYGIIDKKDCNNKSIEYKNTILNVSEILENEVIFSGYASVFNVVDSYNDIILKDSFKETLKAKNVNEIKLLWQHSGSDPIGVFNVIREDNYGLFVEGKLLLDIEKAREARALIKAGGLNGLSIGFIVKKSFHNKDSNLRIIQEINLIEISIVTFPANEDAKIMNIAKCEYEIEKKTKEDIEYIKSLKDVENFLQELGCSKNVSKGLISKVNEFKTQRDVVLEEKVSQCDVDIKNEIVNKIKNLTNFINNKNK